MWCDQHVEKKQKKKTLSATKDLLDSYLCGWPYRVMQGDMPTRKLMPPLFPQQKPNKIIAESKSQLNFEA